MRKTTHLLLATAALSLPLAVALPPAQAANTNTTGQHHSAKRHAAQHPAKHGQRPAHQNKGATQPAG